jgi:predicted ATPase
MAAAREGFIRTVSLAPDRIPEPDAYPFSIPAVRALADTPVELDAGVTFLVGENGSGKSTLVEAIAVAAGFNPEGGTTGMRFSTKESHSVLHRALRLARGAQRPRSGFFLRAESFFNVASMVDRLAEEDEDEQFLERYGGVSLHERSHGESFLALANNRFAPEGLYLLDEPEAALSVTGNLALLRQMDALASEGAQFVVATHSPVLMGLPGATIYELGEHGIARVQYEETEHYRLTRSFLESPERFLRHLLDRPDPVTW